MEASMEKDCGMLGGLFQQIINDLKNGTPLWEDLIYKATKLQACLKATIQAMAAYLDAFQKIADAATNTRGATKEIGTALTRICLRHRAVEAKMKTFTSAIMDCLVAPLQEKLEDWKKSVVNLDKEHAREYKKARTELKKRSTDTLRLQKKMRKGGRSDDLQKAMQDVSDKRVVLEEAEKKSVRAALIEERSRYCLFVTFLKPVVEEEVSMLSELSHLQEVMDQLEKNTTEPYSLPTSSEQVLSDLKGSDAMWTFQSPPPSSPSSLGSRKSSMCSISSLNSSSSGSSKSHNSPNHLYRNRSMSQHYRTQQASPAMSHRLSSISSQDSGFKSQDRLCIRNTTASYFQQQVSDMMEETVNSSAESTSSLAMPTATWPNLQDTLQFEKAATAIMNDRPHTISSAYERGHQRPSLSVYTFQTPENCQSQPCSPSPVTVTTITSGNSTSGDVTPVISPQNNNNNSNHIYVSSSSCSEYGSTQQIYARPPIPQRGSSLERPPSVPGKIPPSMVYTNEDGAAGNNTNGIMHLRNSERTQPTYVNMNELASMAATKSHENSSYHSTPSANLNNNDFNSTENHVEKSECTEKESSASESSLESSSGYGSQSGISVATPTPDHDASQPTEDIYNGILRINNGHHNRYITENHYQNPEIIMQRTNSYASISSAGYCTIKSGTLSRRGSVQSQKPAPPIRRTSSILNTAAAMVRCSNNNSQTYSPAAASASSTNLHHHNLENLPPPPAFLLEGSTMITTASAAIGNSYNDIYGTYRASGGGGGGNVSSFGSGGNVSTTNIAAHVTTVSSPFSCSTASLLSTSAASGGSTSSIASDASNSVYAMKRNVAHSIAAEIQKRNSIHSVEEQIKLAKNHNTSSSNSSTSSSSTSTSQRLLDQQQQVQRKSSSASIHTTPTLSCQNISTIFLSEKQQSQQHASSMSTSTLLSSEKRFEIEGVNVAETVRTLTEMNHQPASPVSIRRTHSNRSISADRRPAETGLIAALSAKIAPNLSPRHSRKQHYQEPPSKLTVPRSSRVRQWIALRTVTDPSACHDSLMDQIKRGAHLRPTGVLNDRSAPNTR